MYVSDGEQRHKVTKDNTLILRYPNDMMNGVYIDTDAAKYIFMSADSGKYGVVVADMILSGVGVVEVPENYNPGEYPHNNVIRALAELTISAAQSMLEQGHK